MCSRRWPRSRAGGPPTTCCDWKVGLLRLLPVEQALLACLPQRPPPFPAPPPLLPGSSGALASDGWPNPKPICPSPALPCARPSAGFNDPWDRLLFKGRDLPADAKLAEQGVSGGAVITVVRRMLAADGWAVSAVPALAWSCWHRTTQLHLPICIPDTLPPCLQIKTKEADDDTDSEEEEDHWEQQF